MSFNSNKRPQRRTPLPALCIHQLLCQDTSVCCNDMKTKQQPRKQKHQVQGSQRKSVSTHCTYSFPTFLSFNTFPDLFIHDGG